MLPLAAGLREALLGAANEHRIFLSWIESAETGDWSGCDKVSGVDGLTPWRLQQCATEAMEWADTVLRSAR
jgi:c-di-GMP-related signal transduction protein